MEAGGQGTRDPSQTWFVAMIGVVLVVGVAIVLAVHAVQPIVVDRYLFAVPVLVSALLAVPAARLARDRWLFGLLALVAVAGAARPMIETGIRPLWRENARTIATIVAGCPTTQVYAASGWALGPAAETRMARREDPVFERAYRSLAAPWGYPVHFIGQNGRRTRHRAPARCCSGTSTRPTRRRTTCRGHRGVPALPDCRAPACRSRAAPRGSWCAPTGPRGTRSRSCRRSGAGAGKPGPTTCRQLDKQSSQ